jgi:hypothetical protein
MDVSVYLEALNFEVYRTFMVYPHVSNAIF